MDFIVANFEFENASRCGDLYYAGSCVAVVNSVLKIAQSADWRKFGKFDESIAKQEITTPIESADFYFSAEYMPDHKCFRMQTDIVGYEAAFLYNINGVFALSDDAIELVKILRKYGENIGLDERHVREYLYYSECFFSDTIFERVKRLSPASIVALSLKSGKLIEMPYNHFVMTGEYRTVEACAVNAVKVIDSYFSSHLQRNIKFAIGMSGGLDSRVGAYFAKKHKYDVQPIFLGVKRNKAGLLTNDVKRAEDVNSAIGFPPIMYYDPRTIDLKSKVEFDAMHAPNMVDNVSQNMGMLEGFDVLINAMMGGEAFGLLVSANLSAMDDAALVDYLLDTVSNKPEFRTKSNMLRRIAHNVPDMGWLNKMIRCDTTVSEDLLDTTARDEIKERVMAWVQEQKRLGLDNINIWHKFFYYRFAVIAKTGYYSTLNNTVPSLATYMNPCFIKEMLKWNSSFLIGRQVQAALISQLGNLASFRSQTVENSINNRDRNNIVTKFLHIFERIVRGGAMVYTDWFRISVLKEYMKSNVEPTAIGKIVQLKNKAWYYGNNHGVLSLMKVAFIEDTVCSKKCARRLTSAKNQYGQKGKTLY